MDRSPFRDPDAIGTKAIDRMIRDGAMSNVGGPQFAVGQEIVDRILGDFSAPRLSGGQEFGAIGKTPDGRDIYANGAIGAAKNQGEKTPATYADIHKLNDTVFGAIHAQESRLAQHESLLQDISTKVSQIHSGGMTQAQMNQAAVMKKRAD